MVFSGDVEMAFVIAPHPQVEVDFSTIVEDQDFTVPLRAGSQY
jgi:hypothetical protein